MCCLWYSARKCCCGHFKVKGEGIRMWVWAPESGGKGGRGPFLKRDLRTSA